jgi:transposase
MPALYRVRLTRSERADLTAFTRRGTANARAIARARALLLADRGLDDPTIATATGQSTRTVQRTRRRCVEQGVDAAIHDRPRPGAPPLLDGAQEAFVVALACTEPPDGHACWTLQLLADRLVELAVVPSISDETVRRTLKKTTSNRGGSSTGASRGSMRRS